MPQPSTECFQVDRHFLWFWEYLKQGKWPSYSICPWNFPYQVVYYYKSLFPASVLLFPSGPLLLSWLLIFFLNNWLCLLFCWVDNKPRGRTKLEEKLQNKNYKPSFKSSRNALVGSTYVHQLQTCTKDLWKRAKLWKMPKAHQEAVHQLVKCKIWSVKAIWWRLRLG